MNQRDYIEIFYEFVNNLTSQTKKAVYGRVTLFTKMSNSYRSDVIKESARKEFEQSKYEQDPEIIARLLVTGRDCLNQVTEKVNYHYYHVLNISKKILQKRQQLVQDDSSNHPNHPIRRSPPNK
jgi:hypothetical protein